MRSAVTISSALSTWPNLSKLATTNTSSEVVFREHFPPPSSKDVCSLQNAFMI